MTDLSRWFVSTEWLAARLDDPAIVIVDGSWHLPTSGRSGRREYDAAHIPGAVFFDIDAIADTNNPLPHMLPTAEQFATEVGALGIDEKQRIVVYDTLGMFSAPRVWWTFRVMGALDVVILEGGLPKWTAEGRPVSADSVRRPPRAFRARFDRARVFDLREVRDGLAAGAIQLVDARPTPRFLGEAPEPRPWVRTGRIPGSRNVPLPSLVEDGHLKPGPALRQAFADAGVDLAKPIVTSCGSGVNAAALNLALDVLGVRGVGLYDGAWTEWGGKPDMPIAAGRPDPVR
jgi:thiosulfate/3-mercaptopyruvate sulfurtransferase